MTDTQHEGNAETSGPAADEKTEPKEPEGHVGTLKEHEDLVRERQAQQAASSGQTEGKQPEGSIPVDPLTPSVSTTAGPAPSAGEFESQRRLSAEATAADLGRHKAAVAQGADVPPLSPTAAGSLNPANVPAPTLSDEIRQVWVRFKAMAHIPPGRTVYPGQVAQIPETHVHPDVHEELDQDDPAIPTNQVTASTAIDGKSEDRQKATDDAIKWLHERLQRVEQEVGLSPQPSHAPPADETPHAGGL